LKLSNLQDYDLIVIAQDLGGLNSDLKWQESRQKLISAGVKIQIFKNGKIKANLKNSTVQNLSYLINGNVLFFMIEKIDTKNLNPIIDIVNFIDETKSLELLGGYFNSKLENPDKLRQFSKIYVDGLGNYQSLVHSMYTQVVSSLSSTLSYTSNDIQKTFIKISERNG
jgi:ribosomal protein L10